MEYNLLRKSERNQLYDELRDLSNAYVDQLDAQPNFGHKCFLIYSLFFVSFYEYHNDTFNNTALIWQLTSEWAICNPLSTDRKVPQEWWL